MIIFFPLNFKKIYIKTVCCWRKNYFTTKRNYLYGHEKDLENIKCPISANDFHINKYIKNLFYMHFMVNMIKYGRWIVFCFIQEVFQETSYDCYSSVLSFHKTLFLRSKWHQMNMICIDRKKKKKGLSIKGDNYYPLANEVAKGYSNATVRPSHPCEHSRINIL